MVDGGPECDEFAHQNRLLEYHRSTDSVTAYC